MKTYIDLTKGIATGYGKAWEFKRSQSARTEEEVCTSLPSSSHHSQGQSSHEHLPSSSGPENTSRNLLHQVCDDLGVDFLGN
jgi:hypothetical protein